MPDSSVNVNAVYEEVPAQVSPAAPEGTPTTVQVDEVHVATDVVITDPSSDLAVQVPEFVGPTTPLHAFVSGKAPEEQFASSDEPEAEPVEETTPEPEPEEPSSDS